MKKIIFLLIVSGVIFNCGVIFNTSQLWAQDSKTLERLVLEEEMKLK